VFIAAGVIYHFTEREIRAFILELLGEFPGSELLIDVCFPTRKRIAIKKVW